MSTFGPKKEVGRLEQVKVRTTKMLRGLDCVVYEKTLRHLGLFSLEKRSESGKANNCLQVATEKIPARY